MKKFENIKEDAFIWTKDGKLKWDFNPLINALYDLSTQLEKQEKEIRELKEKLDFMQRVDKEFLTEFKKKLKS